MAGLDEYRGSKKWEGLIPAEQEPRVWDEGFRSFLTKYVHVADPASNRRNQLFGQLFLYGSSSTRTQQFSCLNLS